MRSISVIFLLVTLVFSCTQNGNHIASTQRPDDTLDMQVPDTNNIPSGKFGDLVKYGRQLMLNTAYYIGPDGINGKYLGNKMNCTNCHQQAGTKPYSFNLMKSHDHYPQYRAREGKVLSLAERVNNCITRPHSGKPLPLDSREMIAFLSYLKWINEYTDETNYIRGEKNMKVTFLERAASPERGKHIYESRCQRCHGADGNGVLNPTQSTYIYPPLWGNSGYQPGSSMHRIIKQAQWLKTNMPYDSATWQQPVLTDEDAMDVAAFVNDDRIHDRPNPANFDYPFPEEKAIDYGNGPFADTFGWEAHKFGPYQPIIDYWKSKGMKATY